MLPISARQLVRFTPSGYDEAARAVAKDALASAETAYERAEAEARLAEIESPPVYLLKPATMLDKQEINASLIAAGISHVSKEEKLSLLEDAVAELVAEHQRAELLELIERLRELDPEDEDGRLDGDEVKRATELFNFAREHYPPFAQALAMEVRWWPYYKWHCVKRLLKGWENVPQQFRLEGALAADECLEALSEEHVSEIAVKLIEMMVVPERARKNSASPSPSPPSPKPSISDQGRQTDPPGDSSEKTTSETQSSA